MRSSILTTAVSFCALFCANTALAYLPPSYFLYDKLAAKKGDSTPALATVLHFKILQRSAIGMDVPMGDFQISTVSGYHGGWPSISLLFPPRAEELKMIVEKFGIPIKKEVELVRLPAEAAITNKTPVRPFYNRDENVKMRRLRNTIAFVHADAMNPLKSIWIDKDSLFPLKIEAPCPPEVEKIPGVKPGAGVCALEFHNMMGAKQGRLSGSKFLFLKDNSILLTFSLEKVQSFKAGKNVDTSPNGPLNEEVSSLVKLLLN